MKIVCFVLELYTVAHSTLKILMEVMVDGTGVLQETHVVPLMENTSHY